MSDHAPLSPSSSERWINCTKSALHNAGGDTGSTYAQQGSEARLTAQRYDLHFIKNFDYSFWFNISDSVNQSSESVVL